MCWISSCSVLIKKTWTSRDRFPRPPSRRWVTAVRRSLTRHPFIGPSQLSGNTTAVAVWLSRDFPSRCTNPLNPNMHTWVKNKQPVPPQPPRSCSPSLSALPVTQPLAGWVTRVRRIQQHVSAGASGSFEWAPRQRWCVSQRADGQRGRKMDSGAEELVFSGWWDVCLRVVLPACVRTNGLRTRNGQTSQNGNFFLKLYINILWMCDMQIQRNTTHSNTQQECTHFVSRN